MLNRVGFLEPSVSQRSNSPGKMESSLGGKMSLVFLGSDDQFNFQGILNPPLKAIRHFVRPPRHGANGGWLLSSGPRIR